jgi:putative endonuclease
MGREPKSYFVYILGSLRGVPYIGVTSDLELRLHQHRDGTFPGFSSRYRTHRLLYYEETDDVWVALEREKQLKGWRRKKKLDLIRRMNPTFADLGPPD